MSIASDLKELARQTTSNLLDYYDRLRALARETDVQPIDGEDDDGNVVDHFTMLDLSILKVPKPT